MRSIGMQIGSVGFKGGFVQVVITLNQRIELLLNIGQFRIREFEFIQCDFTGQKMLNVPLFTGQDKNEGFAMRIGSSTGTSYSVDILPSVIRRIVLNDPVHVGDIQTSGGHISA